MARTAFVTGGTGFVGLNVIKQLVESGWQVTALHRPSSDLSILGRFPVTLAAGDLIDPASILAAMPEHLDAVFHVASDLNFEVAKNAAQTHTNVAGTQHMVDAAITRHAARFVYTSTLATYGVHPGIVTEDTPQTAATSTLNYARTKYLAEEVVRAAVERSLHTSIINSGGILGPYDRTTWGAFFFLVKGGLVPYAPDEGLMTWSHVRDVAAAHEAAATAGQPGANYILGGAESDLYTVLELMAELLGIPLTTRKLPHALIRRYAEVQAEIAARFDEPTIYTPDVMDVFAASYRCDDARARRELGYRSSTLREMVTDAYDWLKSEGLL